MSIIHSRHLDLANTRVCHHQYGCLKTEAHALLPVYSDRQSGGMRSGMQWGMASNLRGRLRLHPAPTLKFKINCKKKTHKIKWQSPGFSTHAQMRFNRPSLGDLDSLHHVLIYWQTCLLSYTENSSSILYTPRLLLSSECSVTRQHGLFQTRK